MKLRAKVREKIGNSTNYIGTIVDGHPAPVTQLPDPDWLEISEDAENGGAYFLFYLDAELKCFADSWHQSLESAKQEGLLGFGIPPGEWAEVNES